MLIHIFLSVTLVLLTAKFYKSVTKHYGSLESMGIRVIKPFLCFGSGPFLPHKIDFQQFDLAESKKSKTWGAYNGSLPFVYTVDKELIKEIFVTKFDYFGERIDLPLGEDHQNVGLAHGQAWKYLRKRLSPIFSNGKLKTTTRPIHEVLDKMVNHLEQLSGKVVEWLFEA